MFGFLIALVYFLINYYGKDLGLYVAYNNAASFLFWWYVVFAVLMALVLAVAWGVATFSVGSAGFLKGGVVGGLASTIGGGGLIAVMAVLALVIRYGALLGGTYLVQTALSPELTWEIPKLIIGGILLFIGILMGRSNSDSSRR